MDFLNVFECPVPGRTDSSSDLFDLFISGSVCWRDPVILFGICETRSLNVFLANTFLPCLTRLSLLRWSFHEI